MVTKLIYTTICLIVLIAIQVSLQPRSSFNQTTETVESESTLDNYQQIVNKHIKSSVGSNQFKIQRWHPTNELQWSKVYTDTKLPKSFDQAWSVIRNKGKTVEVEYEVQMNNTWIQFNHVFWVQQGEVTNKIEAEDFKHYSNQ